MTAIPGDASSGADVVGRLTRHEVEAVAGSRGLAPADLEIRLRADASSRNAVLALFAVAIGWLLVAAFARPTSTRSTTVGVRLP